MACFVGKDIPIKACKQQYAKKRSLAESFQTPLRYDHLSL
jgi:hypothetical protein